MCMRCVCDSSSKRGVKNSSWKERKKWNFLLFGKEGYEKSDGLSGTEIGRREGGGIILNVFPRSENCFIYQDFLSGLRRGREEGGAVPFQVQVCPVYGSRDQEIEEGRGRDQYWTCPVVVARFPKTVVYVQTCTCECVSFSLSHPPRNIFEDVPSFALRTTEHYMKPAPPAEAADKR